MNTSVSGVPTFSSSIDTGYTPTQSVSQPAASQLHFHTPVNQSFTATATPPSSPTVMATSVDLVAPVMTSTQQTPQQLAQSPIDSVANLLINSESVDLTARLLTQSPLANLFYQVMSLFGIKQEASADSSPNNQALVNLKALIEASRPNFAALKTQVAQALEAKSQGNDSTNALIKSAVDQALAIFQESIKASGSLMHFLEVGEKRESLVQVATGLAYQAGLVSGAYSQINSSSVVQNLHKSQNPTGLHNLLNNLTIACMQYGAPAEAIKLAEVSAQAILNMVKTIMQASDQYAQAMGMKTIEQSNRTNQFQPSNN
jgi:hypothetical protein